MGIAEKAAGGAAWNVAVSLGTRVVSLIATLRIAKYLEPHDYGEVVGSVIVAGTCVTLSQMGLAQYLVVHRDDGRPVGFHVTFYTSAACLLALAFVYMARGWVGAFFHVDELGTYLPWLSASTLAESLSIVPERVLFRDLRFRVAALARAAGDLGFSVVSVGLAMAGTGGFCLVYAGLFRVILRLVIYLVVVDWRAWLRPAALSWPLTKAMFSFGLPLSVANVAGSLSVRWDNMVTMRYFGAEIMGAYNYAYGLSELPVTQVGEQVGDVLLPSFARMPPAERREALGRSMALLGLVVFPLAVGLGAISSTLVEVVFDRRWAAVAPMLAVLAVLAVARPISYVLTSYLQAGARVVVASVLEVLKVLVLFTFMVLAAPFGIMPVCAAVGAAFFVSTLAKLFVVTRDGLPFFRTLLRVGRPLLATLPMAAAVLAVRWSLPRAGITKPWLALALEILAGGVVYVAAAFAIAGETAREVLSLGRRAMARPR